VTPAKKKKPTSRAFGKDLAGIYKVVNLVHRFRIYRLFRFVPSSVIIGFAHFFSKFVYGRSKKMNDRVQHDIQAFSGKQYSAAFNRRLADMVFKNLGILLFDVMLKGPNFTTHDYRHVVQLEDDKYLVDAMTQGKGVILVSLHVGEFFHEAGSIILDPRGYELSVVANMANQLIFEHLVQVPQFKRLRVIGRAGFNEIRDRLVKELQKNRMVLLMHDMASGHNLKVPFLPGIKKYLVNVPQGAIALHEITGSPIVPVVTIPGERFTRSTVKFFDPAPILAVSERYRNSPDKIYHGYMSIAINEILSPYLLKYLHCWEELVTMGSRTFDVKLWFDKGASLGSMIESVKSWYTAQVDTSFEPGRDDDALLGWFVNSMNNLMESIKQEPNFKEFALQHKSFINLGGMNTRDQLVKLLKTIKSLASRASIPFAAFFIDDAIHQVNRFWLPSVDME